jgi:hypothetical protein
MPTARPWYSTRPVATKHHDNTRRIEGNTIEDRNLVRGTGKLPSAGAAQRSTPQASSLQRR